MRPVLRFEFMRLDINLASRPYEDARQFWMRWGTAAIALGLLTLVLLAADITGWVNARRDRAAIAQKRAMIAERDRIRASAERVLNLPENRSTRDQSQFLNELIERKAFSWTRVLENLEKVMPPRVHLISINPQLDEDNQLGLKMTVAGDSRDRAIELARRMEESRRFSQTDIVSERSERSGTGETEGSNAERGQTVMPDLRRTRKNLKMALGIMAGVSLVAAVVYFSPLVGSAESRRMEMNQLQADLTTKTHQVAPLKDLPQKVVLARHQITDFYQTRFPSQNSQILTELGKLTSANSVTIEHINYNKKDAEEGGLQPIEMEAALAGNYTSPGG